MNNETPACWVRITAPDVSYDMPSEDWNSKLATDRSCAAAFERGELLVETLSFEESARLDRLFRENAKLDGLGER